VLEAARTWMAKKLEEEGDNPRFERQVHAITLVLDALDAQQEKLPLETPDPAPAAASSLELKPGKVEDELKKVARNEAAKPAIDDKSLPIMTRSGGQPSPGQRAGNQSPMFTR
jgi:hypothetical protein